MRVDGARFWGTLTVVLLVAGVYSGFYALRGWIPHDEGLLGQMAERVLDGELPHADFDEPYSGALTFLNAFSFAAFGHRLSSMRLTLFLFHLGFLASIFAIGARAGSLGGAALVALLCVAWGVPNYSAGLPSWYNLGLAIFAIHATVKYIETNRPGWVFLAGFLGGLSCLFKVAGIYVLLALFVFLIYRGQIAAEPAGERSPARPWLILVALVAPVVFLLGITWARLGVMEVVYFILPATVACGLVAWNELRQTGAPKPSLTATVRPILVLAAGAILPVVVFLLPYVLRNELYSVYRGLIVLPQLRYDYAFIPVPPPLTLLAAIPPALVVCIPLFTQLRCGVAMPALAAVLLVVLLAFGAEQPVYRTVWYSVRPLGPISAVLLCVLVYRHSTLGVDRKQLLFLMSVMAAFLSVIQFPYAFGVYFYYAAPPIVLALLFAASLARGSWTWVQLCFVGFYIGFGALWLNTANVRATGDTYVRSEATELLLPARANLRVSEADKAVYEALVGVVGELAGDDRYILATPDCPEVYFLSRRQNPTRVFYEFFDPERPTPEQLLADLTRKKIRVVVLNGSPEFSGHVSKELYDLLAEAYPEHIDVGWFRVLWKT